ncbi:hypothetical protein C7271_25810 [filamentous cyanobacterium CCP5]|nr:hypothetical protein C7271_25810 [filamentous cyanobacterium CCP5]
MYLQAACQNLSNRPLEKAEWAKSAETAGSKNTHPADWRIQIRSTSLVRKTPALKQAIAGFNRANSAIESAAGRKTGTSGERRMRNTQLEECALHTQKQQRIDAIALLP